MPLCRAPLSQLHHLRPRRQLQLLPPSSLSLCLPLSPLSATADRAMRVIVEDDPMACGCLPFRWRRSPFVGGVRW